MASAETWRLHSRFHLPANGADAGVRGRITVGRFRDPSPGLARADVAGARARCHRRSGGRAKILAEMQAFSNVRYVPPDFIAMVYQGLGIATRPLSGTKR